MFNANLLNVLAQANNVTNSVILRYPETVAMSEDRCLMMRFNTAELDAEEFPEVPLNDSLSDFLRIFKLFNPDERTVIFDGNVISVSDKTHSVKYITYDKSLMTAFDLNSTQFERTKEVPTIAEFTLTPDDIKTIKDAYAIFRNLENVIFESKDGKFTISLGNTSSFNAQSNTYSVTKECTELSKDFKVSIGMDKFSRIPSSTYTIQIKYNSERDKYRIFAQNDIVEMILSCAV